MSCVGCSIRTLFCCQVFLDKLGMMGFFWNMDICFCSQVMHLLDRMVCVVCDLFYTIVTTFWFRLEMLGFCWNFGFCSFC